MLWWISFLNVGFRVVSYNDIFLLFGVNCKEDYMVVFCFIVKFVIDIEVIESKFYIVMGKRVIFYLIFY